MDRMFILLFRGCITAAAGILALMWPALSTTGLTTVFGIYACIDGVINLAMGIWPDKFGDRSWTAAAQGVVGMSIGVAAMSTPSSPGAMMLVVVPWALITGALEVAAAIGPPQPIAVELFSVLGGLMTVMMSLVLVALMPSDAAGWAWTLGMFGLIKGLLLMVTEITGRAGRALG